MIWNVLKTFQKEYFQATWCIFLICHVWNSKYKGTRRWRWGVKGKLNEED
jgi:hypothetical protein